MISQDTKNIIKGFAIATVIFGTIFFISNSKKKKKGEGSDKDVADKNKEPQNKEEAIVIGVVNPEPIAEDIADKSKDAFVHADAAVEVKIPEPTNPISEDAENALRWFVKNKYQIKPFENATDEVIVRQAKSLGWDGNEVVS